MVSGVVTHHSPLTTHYSLLTNLINMYGDRAVAVAASLAAVTLIEIGSLEVVHQDAVLGNNFPVLEKHFHPRAGFQPGDANLDAPQRAGWRSKSPQRAGNLV